MQVAVLYVSTALPFFLVDLIGIKFLIRPMFEKHVGSLLADPLRFWPAVAFYFAYVAGVIWFVSIPALRNDAAFDALVFGALLGLLCYGTYEMTNFATLADWSWEQVLIDGIWGAFLTGVSAWFGVAIVTGKFG